MSVLVKTITQNFTIFNITSFFCGIFIIVICKIYWDRRNFPPGPLAIPYLGSLGFLRQYRRRRHFCLAEFADKYGNVFGIHVGNQLIVFLNGYDAIHKAFVLRSDVYSGRPNWLWSLQQLLTNGKGIVWQDADLVIPLRKFTQEALRGFGVGKTTLERRVAREGEIIAAYFTEQEGVVITLRPVLKTSVTNIIHEIVFGERFDHDDPNLHELIHLIDEFFKWGLIIPQNFMPDFICRLLPKDTAGCRKKQETIEKLHQYIYDQIERHEARYGSDVRDFVDLYVKAAKDDEDADTDLIKGNIFRITLDLFLTGAETVANTLDWCFLFVTKYPDVQRKCWREIDTVIGRTRQVTWSDKGHLPYTMATIKEVLRLANTAPLGVPHATTQDSMLGGYTIPAKTIVISNLYSVSMDRTAWPDPTKFSPARHLHRTGESTREWMLPFSTGPRSCLGEHMAKMEVFVMFANILQQFQLTLVDVKHTHTKFDEILSNTPAYHVTVTERDTYGFDMHI